MKSKELKHQKNSCTSKSCSFPVLPIILSGFGAGLNLPGYAEPERKG